MNNYKNEKGVTLIVLTITIIVLLIITSIIISNSNIQLGIKKVNNLYADIESISTKVTDYYITNNSLPVFEKAFLNDKTMMETFITATGGDSSIINPNDSGVYYVIDLSKLDNLTLNYGKDYLTWSETGNIKDSQDLYIINQVSHQIYYPNGIKYNDEIYYTSPNDSEEIEKVELDTATDTEFEVSKIQAIKTPDENNYAVVNMEVTLSLGEDLKRENLEYAIVPTKENEDDEQNEITYTKFEVDSQSMAKLTSEKTDNSDSYDLYLKIYDVKGTEHKLNKTVKTEDLSLIDDSWFIDDSYVEYDVKYKDIYTDTEYISLTGWRLLNKTDNEDGTCDIDIISTGIPAGLYYNYKDFKQSSYSPWAIGTSTLLTQFEAERNNYAKNYYGNATAENVYAASGLLNHFGEIVFKGKEAGNIGQGYLNSITNHDTIYLGETNDEVTANQLFVARDGAKIRSVIHSDMPNIEKGSGTSPDILVSDYSDRKGLFILNNYTPDIHISSKYWIASPDATSDSGLYIVSVDGTKSVGGTDSDQGKSYYGIRPVITIKNVNLEKKPGMNGHVYTIK